MKAKRIAAIVRKDLGQVFRNRFMAVISLLLILLYALLYNLMPREVEETFRLGLYLEGGAQDMRVLEERSRAEGLEAEDGHLPGRGSDVPPAGEEVPAGTSRLDAAPEGRGTPVEGGLELLPAGSVEDLRGMVERREVEAGLLLDLDARPVRLELYLDSVHEELAQAAETLAGEVAYAFLGHRLPVALRTVMVGPDMAGRQIPLRDKLRVLLLAFVFLLELYGLANLLVEEIQHRTAQAVLVTPETHGEFITAKALTGMTLAFVEGLLLAVLLRAVGRSTWVPLAAFLLLGACLVVGFSFIIGAVSRDFMSMAMISIVPFLLLMLPAFTLLYPGFDSPLLRAIPTYHLVKPLDGVLNYGHGLSDHLSAALYLFLFSMFFFWLGWYILRRRLA